MDEEESQGWRQVRPVPPLEHEEPDEVVEGWLDYVLLAFAAGVIVGMALENT